MFISLLVGGSCFHTEMLIAQSKATLQQRIFDHNTLFSMNMKWYNDSEVFLITWKRRYPWRGGGSSVALTRVTPSLNPPLCKIIIFGWSFFKSSGKMVPPFWSTTSNIVASYYDILWTNESNMLDCSTVQLFNAVFKILELRRFDFIQTFYPKSSIMSQLGGQTVPAMLYDVGSKYWGRYRLI